MEAPSSTCVPSETGMPPGLKITDEASVLLAALAPPRPVTFASCSLMLNALPEATPPRHATMNSDFLRVFMGSSRLVVQGKEGERVGLHALRGQPARSTGRRLEQRRVGERVARRATGRAGSDGVVPVSY